MTASQLERANRLAYLVSQVKEYALAHYETGGWDLVIESMDSAQIREAIGSARTPAGAIRNVGQSIGVFADVRAEHEAEARSGSGPDYFDGGERDDSPALEPAPWDLPGGVGEY